VSKGVISPDGPSLYNPKLPIKRGEFMHYLVNTLFPSEDGRAAATFSDISPNMYYYYSIGLGQEEGLISAWETIYAAQRRTFHGKTCLF
jgi:hypothetical protein